MIPFLKVFEFSGWTGLKVSGRIDAFHDRDVIQAIEFLIKSSNCVALDLSEADFLSLQTLRFLSELNQSLGRKGGELALVRPSHSVRKQIEIFLGTKKFNVYQSLKDLQTGHHVFPRAEFEALPEEIALG